MDINKDPRRWRWDYLEEFKQFDSGHVSRVEQNESRLLSLPQELRDHIFAYLLYTSSPAPEHPSDCSPRAWRGGVDWDFENTNLKIAYPSSLPKAGIAGILATCYRTRSEVLLLIKTRNTSSLPAEIDIMIMGGMVWPNWTLLPCLPSRDCRYSLTVHLRLFEGGGCQPDPSNPRNTSYHRLIDLLRQWATCGPSFTTDLTSNLQYTHVADVLTIRLSNEDVFQPRLFHPKIVDFARKCKLLAGRGDARWFVRKIRLRVGEHGGVADELAEQTWEYDVVHVRTKEEVQRQYHIEQAWYHLGYNLSPDSADLDGRIAALDEW